MFSEFPYARADFDVLAGFRVPLATALDMVREQMPLQEAKFMM